MTTRMMIDADAILHSTAAERPRRSAGADLAAPACARNRANELQVWFVAEHVVDVPLARAGQSLE